MAEERNSSKQRSASRLLVNEYPLITLPTLAKALGLERAVILQQIQYWLTTSGHEAEGHIWIYNTYAQWAEQFPWLSARAVRWHIKALEKEGYLITGAFNRRKADQTKWYRIDYEKLEALFQSHVAIPDTHVAIPDTHVARTDTPLPETTTEINYRDKEELCTNGLLPQLQSLPYWKREGGDAIWLAEFTGEFPEFATQNLIECRDFWDGRRARGKGDWKNRLRNWMKKGRQFAAIRRSAQAEVENKRNAIPSGQKKIRALPTSAELAEQKRRIDEGLPPVERSRYG